MNDEATNKEPSWLERISAAITGEPTTQADLIEFLRIAGEKEIIDQEALGIIERALTVSRMQVREIMVPRPQVVCIQLDAEPDVFLAQIIESGHSRFPVLGSDSDDVVGILLAKDLLPLTLKKAGRRKFPMRDLLRPVTPVPESKRLYVLLTEFRANHNHMAVV